MSALIAVAVILVYLYWDERKRRLQQNFIRRLAKDYEYKHVKVPESGGPR